MPRMTVVTVVVFVFSTMLAGPLYGQAGAEASASSDYAPLIDIQYNRTAKAMVGDTSAKAGPFGATKLSGRGLKGNFQGSGAFVEAVAAPSSENDHSIASALVLLEYQASRPGIFDLTFRGNAYVGGEYAPKTAGAGWGLIVGGQGSFDTFDVCPGIGSTCLTNFGTS